MSTTGKKLIIPIFLSGFLIFFGFANATVEDEINARNKQIEEIQGQIEEYQQQIDVLGGKSMTLQNEISTLNNKIKKAQLEIQSLNLSIAQTGNEISDTQTQVNDAQNKIDLHKATMAELISILYEADQQNLTEVFLKNGRLSDFFNDIQNIKTTQDNLQNVLIQIKDLKVELEDREQQLEDKKSELQNQQTLQQIEKRNTDLIKKDRANLLAQTKGQESKFQSIVAQKKKDIEAIRAQIGYLIQSGLTAEEVIKFGQLAAIGAGIRPAFLIAEAEHESALGRNVGKCYIVDTTSGATRRITNGQIYAKGIHPTRDLGLFLKITSELGLDPFQTPISCGSGWGGAMGLAQFIPSTWMGYRDAVTSITGHNPANPWSIEDAFVAAATKLAKDGANSKTRAGEIAASRRYYCGSAVRTSSMTSSRWNSCVNYANSVQSKAAIIEQNL